MAEGERDDTNEWVLPAQARPATLAQLEQRIDHALAVARASEAAALEIGAAALDAAEQARRAAELAERASRGALVVAEEPEPELRFDSVKHFLERADQISARLESIAPVPSVRS